MRTINNELVEAAKRLATEAHRGQTDKAGNAYIAHPAAVAAAMNSDRERIVAWLHDVVEDTDVTLDDITNQFGPDIAADVDAITRRPDETPDDYYQRLRQRPVSVAVKLADIDNNSNEERLAVLDEKTQTRLRAKYAKARAALTA